jgi:hypothetical protein
VAISVDWGTKVISVPQSYLTLVGGSVYELDVDQFRLDLKDLEDNEAGMSFPDTHHHTAAITLGGVTLAEVVEIINGYTVTFENGSYAVNLVGANNNIGDVTNVNSVSIRSANSAGLVQIISGSGVTEADKDDIRDRILSDATRFAGADIDAAISSRALPGDSDPLGRLDAAITSRAAPSDLANLDAAVSSRATPADIITPRPQRGVALANLTVVMLDSTNRVPTAGLTVSGTIRKDGGTFAALTNAVNEVGNGVYEISLTASEMTADVITLRFTATGATPSIITLVTSL